MVKPYGDRVLEKALEVSEKEVNDYFGTLAEIEMGVSTKAKEQPLILKYVEQYSVFNTMIWKGGLADQPYIFMIEFKMAYDRKLLHDIVIESIRKDKQSK